MPTRKEDHHSDHCHWRTKSAISEFQTALRALNKPELFQARSATSSKTDLVGVSASPKAGAGSYVVEVRSLATSSKVALKAFPITLERLRPLLVAP